MPTEGSGPQRAPRNPAGPNGVFRDPDFLIAGAQRCGTSSLYRHLCSHPMILPGAKKEHHFFDRGDDLDLDQYRLGFPPSGLFPGYLTGEATPRYLFHPFAASRIRSTLDCPPRVLVLVRDPIARAWSQYHRNLRLHREQRSFEEAVEHEIAALQTGAGPSPGVSPDAREFGWFDYLARGLYAEQIQRWRRDLPDAPLLVLESERLFDAPSRTTAQILAFLAVPNARLGPFPHLERGELPTSVDQRIRRRLESFFAADQESLRAVLGENRQ